METEFSNRRNAKRAGGVIVLAFGILLFLMGGFWYLTKGKNKIVSPLPAAPSYEIIFYTPTPAVSVVVTESTPSATPKGFKPSVTPKPTSTPKPSPTTAASPTPKE